MPLTPDEQRIMDHIEARLSLLRGLGGITNPTMAHKIYELLAIKDVLRDIQATRNGKCPCDETK